MIRGGCAAAVAVVLSLAPACGGDDSGDGLDHEGEAGRPIPATFESLVPGVDASLDGRAASHFLLDTGAPVTLADTDDFSDLADGWHTLELEIGDLRFPSVEVGALDAFSYEQTRAAPFSGIIGGNLLSGFALSLDYQGRRVWLEEGAPEPLPDELAEDAVGDAIEIGARVAGGGNFSVAGDPREIGATRFLVRAAVEDQDEQAEGFWVLVDSGATGVVLTNELLDLLGDAGRPRLDGISVGTASGAQTAYLTRVWSMRVGQANAIAEQTSVPALILPDDGLFDSLSAEVGVEIRGVVGGMFLRWYVATLDYAGERLRLLPYVETDHIDLDEFIGVGFEMVLEGGEWVVSTVYPGTDAEAEGMEEGETIAELAGEPVAGLSVAEVDDLLAPFELGDEVPVGLARGGEIAELDVAVEDLLPAFEGPQ